ncbi:hypothetical protein L873DRAFT_1787096 [Choiromyces venosus 120613-1]|uniref:Uncharacterized protein n=1 Tax=Choiromyces venosus 120613-1 TaxID=1336337 RepID=A0A3N4JYH5_9PEZI|nr:hypothetical protein L873DRAFT_1787096 [Choiromyces venosus 120613-1]
MCYHAVLIFSCGHVLFSDLAVLRCKYQNELIRKAKSLGVQLEVQKHELLNRLANGCTARVRSPDARNLEHQRRPCDDCLLARMQAIMDQMEFDRLFDFHHKGLREKLGELRNLIRTVEKETSDRYYTGQERKPIITVKASGVVLNY